jgi:hypothetical protein
LPPAELARVIISAEDQGQAINLAENPILGPSCRFPVVGQDTQLERRAQHVFVEEREIVHAQRRPGKSTAKPGTECPADHPFWMGHDAFPDPGSLGSRGDDDHRGVNLSGEKTKLSDHVLRFADNDSRQDEFLSLILAEVSRSTQGANFVFEFGKLPDRLGIYASHRAPGDRPAGCNMVPSGSRTMADAATAVSAESFPIGSSTAEVAVRAARQGAADARAAAARAWSASGVILARAIYNTTYTVSYGLVFPAAFVAQAIPRENAAVRGFIEGAEAASRRVDQLLGRSAP